MAGIRYRSWGHDIDAAARRQMDAACALPVARAGALMPDAHLGYGLPIGGVLATEDAVIPYAVGVDIACRMRLSVYDRPAGDLEDERQRLSDALEEGTLFGVGGAWDRPREHPVMDEDWGVSPVTRKLKDKARSQLGTSGHGNHFVEFGVLTLERDDLGLAAGRHLALLSHSGSRGAGAEVCRHYSREARRSHPEAGHLAWLELESRAGLEYWGAMQLMGRYAAANHELIHASIGRILDLRRVATVENHHNFAWREEHGGRRLIVHRKGATPAAAGGLAIIPGTMATPAYVVRGKGNRAALDSAAHGAGRRLSRREAKRRFSWPELRRLLDERGVTLLSATLDESPLAYKDIDRIMEAQRDLVEPVARFDPRIVKMAGR